ncbi:MAG: hypothetical protein J0M29_21660 [Chitinophagales bacterium]|nr:hypothetical protein [Chitinophagales bacterium]
MKKLIILLFANITLASTAFISHNTQSRSVEVSQTEILHYTNCKRDLGTKLPLQTDCCYPSDPNTAVGHGARCVSGSQYCVENACDSGTSECGAKE